MVDAESVASAWVWQAWVRVIAKSDESVVLRSFDAASQRNGPTGGSAPAAILPATAPGVDFATALHGNVPGLTPRRVLG